MQRRIAIDISLLVLFVLFAPRHASSQVAESFDDLRSRVEAGDRLRIDDRSGAQTVGRLVRLGDDALVIQGGGTERRYTPDAVRELAVLHHPFWAATLIGAGSGAIIGALSECRGGPHAECADGLIMWSGLGAGFGAAIATLFDQSTVIYRTTQTRTLVFPSMSPHSLGVRIAHRW